MAAPILTRRNTRLPGAFDTDDESSPVKTHFDETSTEIYQPAMEQLAAEESSSALDAPIESSNDVDTSKEGSSVLDVPNESSGSLNARSEDEESQMDILDEEAVTRQLMDFSISDELYDISKGRSRGLSLPRTPRPTSSNSLKSPTSTVIAQHVKDVEVPATVARGYKGLPPSAISDRRNAGEDMTLKEQSNIIDRLIKENWDLKLKITFLDAALAQRSDESIKAMIAENVELKTYKFKSTKDIRTLKLSIQELEKRLKDVTAVATTVEDLKRDTTEMEHDLNTFRLREEELMAAAASAEDLGRQNVELQRELALSKYREKEKREEAAAHAALVEDFRQDNQDLRAQLEDYESFEDKTGGLRDQLSTEKLKTSDLTSHLEGCLDELEQKDRDIQALQCERDDALRGQDEMEIEFHDMRDEAQLNIDTLVKELEDREAMFNKEKQEAQEEQDALELNHAIELKRVSEELESERQGRRGDKAKLDVWQKNHQHSTETVSQRESRIADLEGGIQSERKKLAAVEQQYKDQLGERNNLLLALWNRLSTLCGSDWQHQNSLISGHLPTLEVVSSMLPGFSRNLLLAVKTLESLIGGFKTRIRTIDHNFTKDLQNLEQNLDMRIKRLGRLESAVQASRIATPEVTRLKRENSILKSDIAVMQAQERRTGTIAPTSSAVDRRVSAHRATLMRHHSSSAVESLERPSHHTNGHLENGRFDRSLTRTGSGNPGVLDPQNSSRSVGGGMITENATRPSRAAPAPQVPQTDSVESMEARWNHRLKELEKRLKAEREGRLLDRTGARKRLEEGQAEVEELKRALQRSQQKTKR